MTAPAAPVPVAPAARPSAGTAPAWRQLALHLCLVVAAAGGTFANSLGNGLVYDDVPIIADNAILKGPFSPVRYFRSAYSPSRSRGSSPSLYRPVTMLTFGIDRALFGAEPRPIHAMNIVWNAVAAGLVYLLLCRLCGNRTVPLFAAVLFAVHPVHSEVVANGIGRAELLAAVFGLGAMLVYFTWVEPLRHGIPVGPGPKCRRRVGLGMAAAVALFFLGLASKESAVAMPVILFLIEWLLAARGSGRTLLSRVPRYLLFCLPLALFLVMRHEVIGAHLPKHPDQILSAGPVARRLLASETMLRYMAQLCVPVRLAADYRDYRELPRPGFSDPMVLLSFAAWTVLALAVWWCVRRRRCLPVIGAGWFLLAMLPTSNLIVTIGTLRADRLLFFPSVGFAILLASGITALRRVNRFAPMAVFAVVATAYAARAVHRNRVWSSRETLWRATLADNPYSAPAARFLGDVYLAKGQDELAVAQYKQSTELAACSGFVFPDAQVQYGHLLQRQGKTEDAKQAYFEALRLDPQHFVALVNLGQLLEREPDRLDEASALFRRAIEAAPDNHNGPGNLASACLRAGRSEEALAAATASLAIRADQSWVWALKAEALRRLGRDGEAAEATARARALRRP